MSESKAEKARVMLAAGKSKSEVAKALDMHYSQVHGIAKKLAEQDADFANAQAVAPDERKARRIAANSRGMAATRQAAAAKARIKSAAKGKPAEVVEEEIPRNILVARGKREGDIEKGKCANCGYELVDRVLLYNGREYGRALIHVRLDKDTYENTIQFCEATTADGEVNDRSDAGRIEVAKVAPKGKKAKK